MKSVTLGQDTIQIRVDFPENSNSEKNIWHEKVVALTYFEISENELISKYPSTPD